MDPFAEFDKEERQNKRRPPAAQRPIGRSAEETFREFTETGAAASTWDALRQDNAPDRGTGTGQAHRHRMLRVMARRAADRPRLSANRTWVAPTGRRTPSRPLPSRSYGPPAPRALPPRAPAIRPTPIPPSRSTTSTSGALPVRPTRSRYAHPMPSAGAGNLCNQPFWDQAAMQRTKAAEALRNSTNQPASLKRPVGDQPSLKAAPSSPVPKLSNEPFWLPKNNTAPKAPAAAAPKAPASQPAKASALSAQAPAPSPAQVQPTSQIASKSALPAATKNVAQQKEPALTGAAIASLKAVAPKNTKTDNTTVTTSKDNVANGPANAQQATAAKAIAVEQKSVATTSTGAVVASKTPSQPVQSSSTMQQPVSRPTVRTAPGLPPPGLSALRPDGAAVNNIAGPRKHTSTLTNGTITSNGDTAMGVCGLAANLSQLSVGNTPAGPRNGDCRDLRNSAGSRPQNSSQPTVGRAQKSTQSRDSGESMHAPQKTTTMDGPVIKTSFRLRVRIRRLERTQPLTIHPGDNLQDRAESFCRVWQLDGYEERLYEALKQACKLQAKEVNKRGESGLREAEVMRKSGKNGRL